MKQDEFDFDAPKAEPTPADAETLERIKKLLRLGADRRGNRHECEAALARAFELAQKHHVDVNALDLDEQTARIVHETFPTKQRLSFLEKRVLTVLMMFFHVDVCISSVPAIAVRLLGIKPTLTFVGRASDIAIARYVFDFLVRSGLRCLAGYVASERKARRVISGNKKRQFIQGYIYGLVAKLRESQQTHALTEQQNALVVAEGIERRRKLEELHPNRRDVTTDSGRQNINALSAGFRDGQDTTINQPLNGAPGAPLQLT